MDKFLHNERGISLIEVVVSLLIITLILVSFSGLFLQSKKSSLSSEETLDATYIAQQTMEYLYNAVQQSSSLGDLQLAIQADYDFTYDPTTGYTFQSKTNPAVKAKAAYYTEGTITNTRLVFITTEVARQNEHASPIVMETIWRWGK